jgi:hypothetical protein
MAYAMHVLTVNTPIQPLYNAKAAIGTVLIARVLQLTAAFATEEETFNCQAQLASARAHLL